MCRDTSLGVGEALKREIAGLFLVGCLLLWGFGRWTSLGQDLKDPLNGPCGANRGVDLNQTGFIGEHKAWKVSHEQR